MSQPSQPASARPPSFASPWRIAFAAIVAGALVVAGFWLHASPDHGRAWSWTLLSGAAFGFILQRSRFCFYCGLREFIEEGDSRPVLGLLAALATGLLGYAVVFGAWLPFPDAGHLPPRAHIGPAGWHLLVGGFTFGAGMAFSGSCLSAHFYRLGEGSLLAPVAIVFAAVGFILGFNVWEFFYLRAVTEAPPVWLPSSFGYAGSLAAQFAVLGALAFFVWKKHRVSETPSSAHRATPLPESRSVASLFQKIFVARWPHWAGGVAVGFLSAAVYFRSSPLGVTAELGRLARRAGNTLGVVPAALPGLDSFAGCATVDRSAGALTPNALFVLSLIAAALASGILSNQFAPERPTGARVVLAALGGLLLGFGSMISLGCSIGTLLSGIHAFALSGWIFAAALVGGVWVGLKLRRKLGQ